MRNMGGQLSAGYSITFLLQILPSRKQKYSQALVVYFRCQHYSACDYGKILLRSTAIGTGNVSLSTVTYRFISKWYSYLN